MKGKGAFIGRLASLLLLLALLGAEPLAAADAPRVVVSIKPLHSLLAGLLQGVAEPRLLIDGDTRAWDYRPDAADRQALSEADLVIWSGVELEPGLAKAVPADRERILEVLASGALKVLPQRDDEQRRDPFYWLDSRNMLILLDRLSERLIALDPQRRAVYERNWQRVGEQLSQIDRAMEFGYRDVSGAPVFFYHDTHQYFEQAYAMHIAGSVVRIDGGEQSDAARLLTVRSTMQQIDASCLFVEKGLDEPHADVLVANEGVRMVELDSFGVGLQPGPALYADMMRDNFTAIGDCVRGLKPASTASADFIAPDPSRSPRHLQPRYAMLDQYNRRITHEDFRGKLQVVYFGYTFCPDICPTSLSVLSRAMGMLDEEEAEQIQPIFITVDPQRDTPEVLAGYVGYFHPRMLGLHASPEATRRTAELFRARYEKVPSQSGDPQRYSMDHTASLFVLGRNGEFITKFAHGLPPTEVVARLRDYLHQ